MAKVYKNICKVCGEVFDANTATTIYCPNPECQSQKEGHVNMPKMPDKSDDVKVGVIYTIMQEEKITYGQYARQRSFYIERYHERHGM